MVFSREKPKVTLYIINVRLWANNPCWWKNQFNFKPPKRKKKERKKETKKKPKWWNVNNRTPTEFTSIFILIISTTCHRCVKPSMVHEGKITKVPFSAVTRGKTKKNPKELKEYPSAYSMFSRVRQCYAPIAVCRIRIEMLGIHIFFTLTHWLYFVEEHYFCSSLSKKKKKKM